MVWHLDPGFFIIYNLEDLTPIWQNDCSHPTLRNVFGNRHLFQFNMLHFNVAVSCDIV